MSVYRQSCFVIMPFSKTTPIHTEDYWNNHFDKFLEPLINENVQLKAARSKAVRGSIPREIINALINSPVVVADLTDRNPNVYWELGVRQSFRHGTVTIAEEKTPLPFDIYGKGTIFYSPGNATFSNFNNRFKEAIKDCLDNPDRPDSDVMETISGRGSLFEIFRKEEAIRRLDAVLFECDRNVNALQGAATAANSHTRMDIYRLSVPAIENLLINRYLREKPEFYQFLTDCWEILVVINDRLANWKLYPEDTSNIILAVKEETIKRLSQLRIQVQMAQERIRNQW